jgi:hypothetical protein
MGSNTSRKPHSGQDFIEQAFHRRRGAAVCSLYSAVRIIEHQDARLLSGGPRIKSV